MIKVLMLFLLKQAVKVGAAWSITYENQDICTVKGLSAEFRCSYMYPDEEIVRDTAWLKGEMIDGFWKRIKLSELPSYQNRSEEFCDSQHSCSLVLHNVQDNDTGYYYFWFDTDKFGRGSRDAVSLVVTGLNAKVHPNSVRAGDRVTLECTTCFSPNIVWFRDGRQIEQPEFQAQPEDAGEYSCAAKGLESMQSDAVVLDVWYSPLNVSVEVSPSGLLSVGSSVNLTCSSAAKPVADIYTWFRRINSSFQVQVGSGRVLSLSSMEVSHTGIYVCEAKNRLGQNTSANVTLVKEEANINPFIVLGIGVKVIILLLLPVVGIWVWKRRCLSGADKVTRRGDEFCWKRKQ